jgi:hypothetical protein
MSRFVAYWGVPQMLSLAVLLILLCYDVLCCPCRPVEVLVVPLGLHCLPLRSLLLAGVCLTWCVVRLPHCCRPVEVLVEPYPSPQQPTQPSAADGTAVTVAAAVPAAQCSEQQAAGSLPGAQQQQPVLAVAFISPPQRCIQDGLPTIKRCGGA